MASSSDSGPDRITITVDGSSLACRPDTSVAVALWENGLRHLSHSHKYGRPRGLSCARGHCTGCLMRIDGIPNVRTCETSVHEGMVVSSQDTGTFYGGTMQRLLFLGSAWVPVGFYYKWFTRPASLSRLFLERIRPMTGVGRLPATETVRRALPAPEDAGTGAAADLGHHDHLVVGAGLSGLQAACALDGDVLLIDDAATPGGQRRAALEAVAAAGGEVLPRFTLLNDAHERLSAAAAVLAERPNIRFLGGAKVVAGYRPGGVVVRHPQGVGTAGTKHLVWAAGALDTHGRFPGNDSVGLFGPRALYRIVARDGLDVSGCDVLVVGGGLDLWLSAALLHVRGARLHLVVTGSGHQAEVAAAVDLKWPLTTGLELQEIAAVRDHRLQATFVPRHSTPGPRGSRLELTADMVVNCGRGKPAYDIPFQLGADFVLDPARGGYVPRGSAVAAENGFDAELPGGTSWTCTGEALGLQPAELVTR